MEANKFTRVEMAMIMAVVGARISELLDLIEQDNAAPLADSTLEQMRRQSNARYLSDLRSIYNKLDVAIDDLAISKI